MSSLRSRIADSYYGKKFLHSFLQSFIFTHNPLYRFLFLREARKKMPSLERLPLFVIIENTNQCNLSCVFCANEQMQRQRGFIAPGLFASIIDQCSRLGIENVLVQGFGEPLLDKDYILKIKLAKEKGIKNVHCVTNGIFLDKTISEGLIRAGLDYIYISMDAATPEVYGRIHHMPKTGQSSKDFFAVVENLEYLIYIRKKLNLQKPFIEVRFKDFAANKRDLIEFMRKYRGRTDKVNIYMNITNWPGSSVQSNLPRTKMLKFPCYNLWSTLYITYSGKAALCCQDYECRVEIGDVNKENILGIWKGKKLAQLRETHLKGRYGDISVCRDCVINTHYVTPWW